MTALTLLAGPAVAVPEHTSPKRLGSHQPVATAQVQGRELTLKRPVPAELVAGTAAVAGPERELHGAVRHRISVAVPAGGELNVSLPGVTSLTSLQRLGESTSDGLSWQVQPTGIRVRAEATAARGASSMILTGLACTSRGCGNPVEIEARLLVLPPASAGLLAAGSDHTCVVTLDGGAACWGAGTRGQLGNGSFADSAQPVPVAGLREVSALAAGSTHTCALTRQGEVWCWGAYTAADPAPVAEPVRLDPLTAVTQISAGDGFSCALGEAGWVQCWGTNALAELGSPPPGTDLVRTPVTVAGLSSGATALGSGDHHSCAATANDELRCWGYNRYGQLAWPDGLMAVEPVVATEVHDVVAIDGGVAHTCVRTGSGGARCWGLNYYGQVGNVDLVYRYYPYPQDVTGLDSHVRAVTTGGEHSCAVGDAGAVRCWGRNDVGQLGDPAIGHTIASVPVPGLAPAAAVAAGRAHTCALSSRAVVSCWGGNEHGQLGVSGPVSQPGPLTVALP